METICIFPDEQERQKLFAYLNELEIEYHKPYKRFNQTVKVPRGQASFTLHNDIHYNYKASGGSPPNKVMCDTLRMITSRMSQVCRQSARDAGLVALAAAHASPDMSLTTIAWIQRLLGHATWLCFSQIASQQLERPSKIEPSRGVCVQLRACRRCAERSGRLRSGL